MRVWVAAGGTGGHLYPALAVAEELGGSPPLAEFRFAVSRRGLEEKVLGGMGLPFTTLSVEGFHRGEVLRNILFPFRALAGLFQSFRVLRRFRPHVAVGTGGFVSGPALLAAWMCRVPLVLVALDAKPGVTIRLLSSLAARIYVTRPEAKVMLGSRPTIQVIGTPVRQAEPIDRRAARSALGLPRQGNLLFVTGGSQGSRALNEALATALDGLLEIEDLSILWQCGQSHLDGARAAVEEVLSGRAAYDRPRVRVEPFIHEMVVAWSAADLALCRAGASTIAELGYYEVPSILVPLSSAAGGHQEVNARAMERAGASRLLLEADLTPAVLVSVVRELIAGERLEGMASSASRMSHAGAAHSIAEGLVEMATHLDEEERTHLMGTLRGEGT